MQIDKLVIATSHTVQLDKQNQFITFVLQLELVIYLLKQMCLNLIIFYRKQAEQVILICHFDHIQERSFIKNNNS